MLKSPIRTGYIPRKIHKSNFVHIANVSLRLFFLPKVFLTLCGNLSLICMEVKKYLINNEVSEIRMKHF